MAAAGSCVHDDRIVLIRASRKPSILSVSASHHRPHGSCLFSHLILHMDYTEHDYQGMIETNTISDWWFSEYFSTLRYFFHVGLVYNQSSRTFDVANTPFEIMPPRKSTSSIPPADNEEPSSPTSAVVAGTQATEQQLKAQSEGVSVEVLYALRPSNPIIKFSIDNTIIRLIKRKYAHPTTLERYIGSPASTRSNAATRKKRSAARYGNSERCIASHSKGCYCLCLVSIFPVRYFHFENLNTIDPALQNKTKTVRCELVPDWVWRAFY